MEKTFRSIKNQLGISLLEIMLSLSIIAIILIMATRYFFVATTNNKMNATISQVAGLISAAESWKSIRTNFDGLSIQALYEAGQLEKFPGLNDSSSPAQVNDLWGDSFSLAPTSDKNKATITLTLPNSGNCKALSNSYIGSTCQGQTFMYTFS